MNDWSSECTLAQLCRYPAIEFLSRLWWVSSYISFFPADYRHALTPEHNACATWFKRWCEKLTSCPEAAGLYVHQNRAPYILYFFCNRVLGRWYAQTMAFFTWPGRNTPSSCSASWTVMLFRPIFPIGKNPRQRQPTANFSRWYIAPKWPSCRYIWPLHCSAGLAVFFSVGGDAPCTRLIATAQY